MHEDSDRARHLKSLSDMQRRLIEEGNAEWDRRVRENDFNHDRVVPEKAMGFPGDTILIRRAALSSTVDGEGRQQVDHAPEVTAATTDTMRASAAAGTISSAEQAQQSVQRILDGWARDGGVSCLAQAAIDEGDRWVVGFQSRAFVVDGDLGAALAGNAPFAVPKDGSAPYQLPS